MADSAQSGAADWGALVARAAAPPEIDVGGDDAAHLSYTSGSSGVPKGALLAHGATARATACIAERLQLSSADVSIGPTSPASSYGLVANLLPGIHRGATVGLMSRWDRATAWDHMEDHGVTYFPGNPILFADLLEECRRRSRKPSKLRLAVSGGGPVPLDLKRAFRDEIDVHLVESYGQSELGGFVALGRPRHERDDKLAAIGPALPDKEVRIMADAGHEADTGEPGEIRLRGGFMLGYWDMADKTAEAIGDGWLRTGDIGRMDPDGYISMLGRSSERIVTNGRSVYPRPIEESLSRHPAVEHACVIGKPDADSGEIIKAIVTLRPATTATVDALSDHCRDDPGLADCPAEVEIIDDMPMTATGKIGRKQLQERERGLLPTAPDGDLFHGPQSGRGRSTRYTKGR